MNRITATGIPEREFNALKAFFLRSTVPLVYESGEVAGIQGTGCLFEANDSLYFVTAGHVLKDVNPEKLGIPIRQHDGEISTLGLGLIGWSTNEVFDVAVYRIDDSLYAKELRKSYSILDRSNVGHSDDQHGHYIIPGYPRATVPKVGNTLTPSDITQIHTVRYEGEIIGTRTPFDLFFELDRNAWSLWGKQREVPDLRGISGAPIWQLTKASSDIWTPEQCLRLIGIQVACGPESRSYIRALNWAAVEAALMQLKSAL